MSFIRRKKMKIIKRNGAEAVFDIKKLKLPSARQTTLQRKANA